MDSTIRLSTGHDEVLKRLGLDWRALGWGNILVALPFVHVAISTLFLVGYCAGFGAHLGRYVRPEDIFAISISEVVMIYLIIIVQVALFSRIAGPTPRKAKSGRETYGPPSPHIFRPWVGSLASLLVVVTLIVALTGYAIGQSVRPSVIAIVLVFEIIVRAKRNAADRRAFFYRMLAVTLIVPVVMGAEYGQDDRHKARRANDGLMKCGESHIHRPIGGKLLGYNEKSHALFDEQCKPVLIVPEIDPVMPRETTEAIKVGVRQQAARFFGRTLKPSSDLSGVLLGADEPEI